MMMSFAGPFLLVGSLKFFIDWQLVSPFVVSVGENGVITISLLW